MVRLKKWRCGLIILIIVAAVGGIWTCYSAAGRQPGPADQGPAPAETGVTVGKAAPAFTLDSPEGNQVSVGAPGKWYVLNFWATWCPPCRAEIPELVKFAGQYGGQVQFYAINLQEPAEKVSGFLQQNGYALPVLLDKNGTVAQTYRVTAIPTTIIIDSRGIIQYRKTGGVTLAELAENIRDR